MQLCTHRCTQTLFHHAVDPVHLIVVSLPAVLELRVSAPSVVPASLNEQSSSSSSSLRKHSARQNHGVSYQVCGRDSRMNMCKGQQRRYRGSRGELGAQMK